MIRLPPRSTLFPYATLCRSLAAEHVSFQCADGLRIAAWYFPSRNGAAVIVCHGLGGNRTGVVDYARFLTDRKSTRLNSSHANISYAVFCSKKRIPAFSFTII